MAIVFLLAPAFAAAQPIPGSIAIAGDSSAQLFLNDAPIAAAPHTVHELKPGKHVLRMVFPDLVMVRSLRVDAGRTTHFEVRYPALHRAVRYRQGLHALVGMSVFGLAEWDIAPGYGGHLNVGLNKAFNPRRELRLALFAGGGVYGQVSGSRQDALELTLATTLRINASHLYGFELGVRGGLVHAFFKGHFQRPRPCETGCQYNRPVNEPNFVLGPQFSASSFRFGARNNLELTLSGTTLFVAVGRLSAYIEIALTMTYLFLDGS